MLGASRIYIGSLFIIEAALIGAFYGLLAFISADFALQYINDNITNWLPVLPVQQGETIFSLNDSMFLNTIFLSSLSAICAVIIPSIVATRSVILETLRKS